MILHNHNDEDVDVDVDIKSTSEQHGLVGMMAASCMSTKGIASGNLTE